MAAAALLLLALVLVLRLERGLVWTEEVHSRACLPGEQQDSMSVSAAGPLGEGEGEVGCSDDYTTSSSSIPTPATSCQELKEWSYPSGEYWIQVAEGTPPSQFYCDMERECGGIGDGWTRIAYLNMTDRTQHCPENWREITEPRRSCGRRDHSHYCGAGCSSTIYRTNQLPYTHICGRIIGYQFCRTLGFNKYFHDMTITINDPFLDGVTLSRGETKRKHIWSFVAAFYEDYNGRDAICPCTNQLSHNYYRQHRIPWWVKNDYFCETGANKIEPPCKKDCIDKYEKAFFADDPLWDGEGCSYTSKCCKFNNPPWFYKKLGEPSKEDIEVRICAGARASLVDTPVELLEIYLR